MSDQALSDYSLSRLRAGASKSVLRDELLALGWTEEEADASYRQALVASGAPVPTEVNRPYALRKAGAVDVVINFFSFILLGIVATALGTLLFQVVNIVLPDVLDTVYGRSGSVSSIHYAIAALLIGFPLYFLALRLWFQQFRDNADRTESGLSKWLTYLVLLVTAIVVVGDLITLVFAVLQGELSLRFFLKALIILGIAGAIFGFYYLERRKIQYRVDIPRETFQHFGRGMSLIVVLAIVLGFFVAGSPDEERSKTLDMRRADQLSALASCVEQYSLSLGALPASLDDLRQSNEYNSCSSFMTDPETGLDYEYRIVTPSRVSGEATIGEFELCATFTASSKEVGKEALTEPSLWHDHGAGQSCDTVTTKLGAPYSNPAVPVPVR